LYAIRVYLETSFKYFTAPGFKIQIFAGIVGVDNPAPRVFEFFQTTSSTLVADGIPTVIIFSCIVHEVREKEILQGFRSQSRQLKYITIAALTA
jgi:hypothetical protein